MNNMSQNDAEALVEQTRHLITSKRGKIYLIFQFPDELFQATRRNKNKSVVGDNLPPVEPVSQVSANLGYQFNHS